MSAALLDAARAAREAMASTARGHWPDNAPEVTAALDAAIRDASNVQNAERLLLHEALAALMYYRAQTRPIDACTVIANNIAAWLAAQAPPEGYEVALHVPANDALLRRARKAEAAADAYRWGYGYLQDRMRSVGRHGWAADCDDEIEHRIGERTA